MQARAGVSRGALLHHFPSRAELLAATVEHLFQLAAAEMLSMAPRGARRIEGAVAVLWNLSTSTLATAAQELWTAARTDEELRAALLLYDAQNNTQILLKCAELFGPDLAAHPHYDFSVRVLLHAMRGAAQLRSLHPERTKKADLAFWTQTMKTLLA